MFSLSASARNAVEAFEEVANNSCYMTQGKEFDVHVTSSKGVTIMFKAYANQELIMFETLKYYLSLLNFNKLYAYRDEALDVMEKRYAKENEK